MSRRLKIVKIDNGLVLQLFSGTLGLQQQSGKIPVVHGLPADARITGVGFEQLYDHEQGMWQLRIESDTFPEVPEGARFDESHKLQVSIELVDAKEFAPLLVQCMEPVLDVMRRGIGALRDTMADMEFHKSHELLTMLGESPLSAVAKALDEQDAITEAQWRHLERGVPPSLRPKLTGVVSFPAGAHHLSRCHVVEFEEVVEHCDVTSCDEPIVALRYLDGCPIDPLPAHLVGAEIDAVLDGCSERFKVRVLTPRRVKSQGPYTRPADESVTNFETGEDVVKAIVCDGQVDRTGDVVVAEGIQLPKKACEHGQEGFCFKCGK